MKHETTESDHELERLHEVIATRLVGAKQRYTSGRERLIEAMYKTGRPMSMPEFMVVAPEIPQSSAYRSLVVLSSVGVVHRIAGTDDSGYFEIADDLIGTHHHHVMCLDCGKVIDVNSSQKLERALAEAASIAAHETGYTIDAHRIDLVGKCPDCQ